MISFIVQGIPVAKGRPKFVVRGRYASAYTPKKTREAEDDFRKQCRHAAPEEPLEGPLKISIVFHMKKPKVMKGFSHHIKRPDVDNLLKLVLDSMNGVFYKDDSQIVSITAGKYYSEDPRTLVSITKI